MTSGLFSKMSFEFRAFGANPARDGPFIAKAAYQILLFVLRRRAMTHQIIFISST